MTLPQTDQGPTRARLVRRFVGEPITVGDRTIQPVARLTGWHGSAGSETGDGVGAWLRVTPVEILVRESDESEYSVPITDPTAEAMRGIVLSALLVAALCWWLMRALHRKTHENP